MRFWRERKRWRKCMNSLWLNGNSYKKINKGINNTIQCIGLLRKSQLIALTCLPSQPIRAMLLEWVMVCIKEATNISRLLIISPVKILMEEDFPAMQKTMEHLCNSKVELRSLKKLKEIHLPLNYLQGHSPQQLNQEEIPIWPLEDFHLEKSWEVPRRI